MTNTVFQVWICYIIMSQAPVRRIKQGRWWARSGEDRRRLAILNYLCVPVAAKAPPPLLRGQSLGLSEEWALGIEVTMRAFQVVAPGTHSLLRPEAPAMPQNSLGMTTDLLSPGLPTPPWLTVFLVAPFPLSAVMAQEKTHGAGRVPAWGTAQRALQQDTSPRERVKPGSTSLSSLRCPHRDRGMAGTCLYLPQSWVLPRHQSLSPVPTGSLIVTFTMFSHLSRDTASSTPAYTHVGGTGTVIWLLSIFKNGLDVKVEKWWSHAIAVKEVPVNHQGITTLPNQSTHCFSYQRMGLLEAVSPSVNKDNPVPTSRWPWSSTKAGNLVVKPRQFKDALIFQRNRGSMFWVHSLQRGMHGILPGANKIP